MTSDNSRPTFDGDFQPDPAQFQDLAPGYFLGEHQNYRLEKKLGEGGMGQTWLAMKVVGGRDFQKVVCKLLVQELRDDTDAMKEVERVFHLTQSLYHPNICPLLGIDMDPVFGTFLVMAYAEGETLREWFQAQPGHENGLPMSSVLPILYPIADALDTVHREGVFHRDVKPENIVFRKPGEFDHPWLLDFGIAARIHTEETNTTTGRSRTNSGTPAYMAPEQHVADPQNASTDQYSLAVLTYELLAGRLPFPGRNREHYAVLKTLPPSPIAHLAASVNNALFRALNREMTARFPTCTAFFEALCNGEERERQERERQEREKTPREKLEDELKGQFQYSISGDSVTITKYTGSASAVTIPRGVTSIGNGAFSYCSTLTSVTIPNSVTSIGYYAFSCCGRLTSVTIPNSVTSIGYYAFSGCDSLTSVTIPDSVTSIGNYAFCDCKNLTSVMIPNSVTSIGNYAFIFCESLTSVTIPNGVTSIGYAPFTGCDKLTEIQVSAGNTHFKSVDGILFSADGKTLIQVPCGKGLTECTIPNSVTSIGSYAFSFCESLTSVTIPNRVTSIGNRAFIGCRSLKSVTIPDSVTSIGDEVFSKCTNLVSVTIPSTVKRIGENAFGGCESLTIYGTSGSEAEKYAKKQEIQFQAVAPASAAKSASTTEVSREELKATLKKWKFEYTIDGNTVTITKYTGSASAVTIPHGVTSIGNEAFSYCSILTSVTIPNSVTRIGKRAFDSCKSLTSVTIPNSVTSIGYSAFHGCNSLTSVTIPDSVTSIGNWVFYNCSSLTSVTIPDSVTSIGEFAFWYCENLKSVTIPNSVTSIGREAFAGCPLMVQLKVKWFKLTHGI